ncbi:hypothetical protein PI23P_09700 [Polaribacter irgensii 23-P]|uniref:Uncharacterized protein n=1 Tax=Polaribacter irgensii 23-P TaxID=313594 RepID=A4C0E9_9FLAO|nr:hypothetical protein PI23P_09700 [Polaribacter irgensii 23-P]
MHKKNGLQNSMAAIPNQMSCNLFGSDKEHTAFLSDYIILLKVLAMTL